MCPAAVALSELHIVVDGCRGQVAEKTVAQRDFHPTMLHLAESRRELLDMLPRAVKNVSPRWLRLLLTVVASAMTTVGLLVIYHSYAFNLLPSPWSHPEAAAAVDWSKFAYVQYATNSAYLCNSLMLFELLDGLDSKADRLLMYPQSMAANGLSDEGSEDVRLLNLARDKYNVRLQPIQVQHRPGPDRKLHLFPRQSWQKKNPVRLCMN